MSTILKKKVKKENMPKQVIKVIDICTQCNNIFKTNYNRICRMYKTILV